VDDTDEFEWDPYKAAANLQRHGVSFEEAATVFDDELALTVPDAAHSYDELREFTIGVSRTGRLIAMAHTLRGDRIRIISARPAERRERRQYESDRP
jgi:uncharacterized DUF497 family protein